MEIRCPRRGPQLGLEVKAGKRNIQEGHTTIQEGPFAIMNSPYDGFAGYLSNLEEVSRNI